MLTTRRGFFSAVATAAIAAPAVSVPVKAQEPSYGFAPVRMLAGQTIVGVAAESVRVGDLLTVVAMDGYGTKGTS